MDYTGHYCVTLNKTEYQGTHLIKWDLYDWNLSKVHNNNEVHPDLEYCANMAFFNIWQTLQKFDVKFVTFVTNWEALINQVYDRTGQPVPNYIPYFKDLFIGRNYIIMNVFDTELINEFYSWSCVFWFLGLTVFSCRKV